MLLGRSIDSLGVLLLEPIATLEILAVQNDANSVLVAVCRGTACHVGGARFILEELERTLGIPEGQTTEDMEYSLETVACIGCCGLAPCISVNGEVSAKLTPKKVRKKFKKARK